MLTKSILALAFVTLVSACGPLTRRTINNATSYPSMVTGPDTPSDPATKGYFTNHMSLNVNNLNRSIDFYTQVFGFRHMFTYYLTPHLSVTYLAHASGGRNGTGYQTTQEIIRDKNNAAGKIELVHFTAGGNPILGPEQQTSTLSHLGIIVPDTQATQARLEKLGVKIHKKIGEPLPNEGYMGNPFSLGDATDLKEEDWRAIQDAMSKMNVLNIFAADPDGNLLEIQPMDEGALFG